MKKRSFEDYEEMALYLRTGIQLLHHVSITYNRAKFSDRMMLIDRKLESIKSDLEEEMFKDYPERASTHVFYGGGGYTLNLQKQKDCICSYFGENEENKESQGGKQSKRN